MNTRKRKTLPDWETLEQLERALADLRLAETVLIIEFFRNTRP